MRSSLTPLRNGRLKPISLNPEHNLQASDSRPRGQKQLESYHSNLLSHKNLLDLNEHPILSNQKEIVTNQDSTVSLQKRLLRKNEAHTPDHNHKNLPPLLTKEGTIQSVRSTGGISNNLNTITDNRSRELPKPMVSWRISFANMVNQIGDGSKSQEARDGTQKSRSRERRFGQILDWEDISPVTTQHFKKVISLKKFLRSKISPPRLTLHQQHADEKERPWTSRTIIKKNKFGDCSASGQNWFMFSDSSSEDIKEVSQSTYEEGLEKETIRKSPMMSSKPTLSKKFIPTSSKSKESLSPWPVESSNKVFFPSDKNLLEQLSIGQRDDKSRENSIKNESKISVFISKTGDDKRPGQEKLLLGNFIRRKSDTSKYSGGECLKLMKNLDIILPSDQNKKTIAKMPISEIEKKKEEVMMKYLNRMKTKKDNSSLLVKKEEIYVADQPNEVALETITSSGGFQPNQPDHNNEELNSAETKESQKYLVDKGTEKSVSHTKTARLPKQVIQNLDQQGKNSVGTVTHFVPKSKTPEPGNSPKFRIEDMSNHKGSQPQTQKVSRHKKIVLENRMKEGDLKNALQLVLTINKKARKTVFKNKSSEGLKMAKAKGLKEESNYLHTIGLEKDRTLSSPYYSPINFRSDSTRAFLISANEDRRDVTLIPLKKQGGRKKSLMSKRAKSVSRFTPMTTIEKTHS